MKKHLIFIALSFLMLPTPFYGEDTLPRFTADYKISVNIIPASLKARLTLAPVPNTTNQYQLEVAGKNFVGKYRETSLITGSSCSYKSLHHEFSASGLGLKRNYTTDFNWEDGSAHFTKKKESSDFPITNETIDELSFYLEIRCQLMAGKKDIHIMIARRGDVDKEEYQVVAEEDVETPVGIFSALKIKRLREGQSEDGIRETFFWVAPELDYLPIKIKHIENSRIFGKVELIGVSIPSKNINITQKKGSKREAGRP